MQKIKIGLFIDNYFPSIDGVIMVVDNYAKRLSKYAEVVVVAPSYGKKDQDMNFPYKIIRVKSIKIPTTKYTYALPKSELDLFKRLVNENFDIIHVHSPFSIGKLGVSIAKTLNIPVIGTMHTQMKYEFMKYTKSKLITDQLTLLTMKVYDQCDECWAVNNRVGEIFCEYGYKGKYKVQENGTDMELLTDEEKSNEYVNKLYDIESDQTVLLFVGRLTVEKNILFIAEVLKEIKNKKYDFKMLFVGNGPDEKKLREKIKELELEDNVILCGQVKDRELLKKIYLRSKLFVFPSLFDANSLVQIEAASQKTPTIFLEGSATSSTIKPEINGFIAKNNVKKFAEKLIDILNNKEKYDKVKENAYKQVYKSWDNIVKDVYKKYLNVIKKYNKGEYNEKL